MGRGLVAEGDDWAENDQVMEHVGALEPTLPEGTRVVFDWSYSKGNQGKWTKKTMTSLWFTTNAGKGQMIDALKNLRQILVDQNYKVRGGNVRCAFDVSTQRRSTEKAHAMFFSRLWEEARGDLGRLHASWRAIQITMYAELA